MPKTTAAVTPAIAAAVGQTLGIDRETLVTVYQNRTRYPGQLGVLAVDPGDKHIGMAAGLAFAQPDPDTGKVIPGSEDELIVCWEVGYFDGLASIDHAVNAGWVDLLVVEDWMLYEDKVQDLVGSRCDTARMLGGIEQIVRKYNRFGGEVSGHQVELLEQPASAQVEARELLRRYKVDRTSKDGQPHALSAELHWWFAVMVRRGMVT